MKRIIVEREGSSKAVPIELVEEDTPEQIVQLVTRLLELNKGGRYVLVNCRDGCWPGSDIFGAVAEGDTLTVHAIST